MCPQFQVPVGSGFILYGVNSNLIQDNAIYDNWRSGVRLFWVPASVRGENDPAKQFDTSNHNRFIGNQMGLGADNKRAPNGVDFFWDEQGIGNCWRGNQAPGGNGHERPGDAPAVPPGLDLPAVANPEQAAAEAPCATWDPDTQPDPPGCTWFTTPAKPRR